MLHAPALQYPCSALVDAQLHGRRNERRIGPDGLVIDQQDNIAACHVGFGAVWLFSNRGEPMLRMDAPEGRMTTNAAFGGPDNRTLYITESSTGTILTARMPVAGSALFSTNI